MHESDASSSEARRKQFKIFSIGLDANPNFPPYFDVRRRKKHIHNNGIGFIHFSHNNDTHRFDLKITMYPIIFIIYAFLLFVFVFFVSNRRLSLVRLVALPAISSCTGKIGNRKKRE